MINVGIWVVFMYNRISCFRTIILTILQEKIGSFIHILDEIPDCRFRALNAGTIH